MARINRYLDYSGTYELWRRIVKLCDKKLESVTPKDDSIVVTDKNKISVKISKAKNNLIKLKAGEGLCVDSLMNHKLTFGADQEYVYDGSEDVTVPVYTGKTD